MNPSLASSLLQRRLPAAPALLLALSCFACAPRARAEWPWALSTRPDLAPAALDCPLRALVAGYSSRLNSVANASDVARSLRLAERRCTT